VSSMGVPPMFAEDVHGQTCSELAEEKDCNTHGRDGDPKRDESRLGTHAHATEPQGGTPNGGGDELCGTKPIDGGVSSLRSEVASVLPTSDFPLSASAEPSASGTPNADGKQACETNPIPEPNSAPKRTPPEPPRPRMYPNTAKEMTYDFGLRRWVMSDGTSLRKEDAHEHVMSGNLL
jgi:hypothetical protein